MKRVLILPPQPTLYGTQSEKPLEGKVEELPKKPKQTILASTSQAYPTSNEETTHIEKEHFVKKKILYLLVKYFKEADFRYSGSERSHTDENSPKEKYRSSKKSEKKTHGESQTREIKCLA